MKRTSAWSLVVLAVAGAAAGYGIDLWLTAAGRPTFTPSPMLPILLVLLGAGCLLLGWQVRRGVTGDGSRRVDPFRSVRIAALSKAASLVGALIAGAAGGLILFLLTRPVSPPLGSMSAVVATAIGGVVLVVLALIAEHLCTLPKDPDDRSSDTAEPGAEPGY